MVKIMSKNKFVLLLTVIAIILIVALPTIFKIYQRHEARMYEVASRKILEKAEECYRDQICQNKTMTIEELKKTGYLKTDVVNPRTKTYFDLNLVMQEENFKVTFIE